jgi:hypothetical protein
VVMVEELVGPKRRGHCSIAVLGRATVATVTLVFPPQLQYSSTSLAASCSVLPMSQSDVPLGDSTVLSKRS